MAITKSRHERFNSKNFDVEIEAHGTCVLWRRSRTCPCISRAGDPDPNCPLCLDYPGIVWDDGSEISVIAPGRKRDDRYGEAGYWMEGMVQLTFPTCVTPGHLDRLEFKVGVMVIQNELHVRGEVDPLGRSLERLRFRHALEVEFCGARTGTAPNYVLTEYASPDDFSIAAGGAIEWVAGHGPGANVQYSMRYTARPTFLLLSPMSRDEAGNRQPYRAIAKRLDFFDRPAVGA